MKTYGQIGRRFGIVNAFVPPEDVTPEQAAEAYREAVSRRRPKADASGSSGFRSVFYACESPIEQAFCLELFQMQGVFGGDGELDLAALMALSDQKRITVFPQHPILRYRADFLLVGTSRRKAEPIFVIVECDGQAYHSTREQLRRDEGRQKALQDTGFKIVRHSGSEIFRQPERVVLKTIAAFRDHGWSSHEVDRFVNGSNLRRALAELRETAL